MASGLVVDYEIFGLTDGQHPFHVHRWGDIGSSQATFVGGHFIGNCSSCRPNGMPQEVGLLNDGVPLQSTASLASGQFTDTVAKLRGQNTILGRAIVVHGDLPNRGTERHA